MIDAYLEEEEKKEAEKVEWQKLAKEKGIYEVAKILDVQFEKGVGRNPTSYCPKSLSACGKASRGTFAAKTGFTKNPLDILFQKREFHVRWKGWGPEGDTIEPEDNLDCPDLIEKFMDAWEKKNVVSEKQVWSAVFLNALRFGPELSFSKLIIKVIISHKL